LKAKDVLAGPGHGLQLYRAVRRYVKANGGNLLVIGGVEIQFYGDRPSFFKVAIGCTGKPPTFPPASSKAAKKARKTTFTRYEGRAKITLNLAQHRAIKYLERQGKGFGGEYGYANCIQVAREVRAAKKARQKKAGKAA